MKHRNTLEDAVHGIFLLLGLLTVGCVLLITVYLILAGVPAIAKIGLGRFLLGRVDVALDAGQAWVAWLREDDKGQVLMLARYAPDLSKRLQSIEVARLPGRGRATGVPKLAVDAGGAWLAWTDVVDGTARLQGARIAR